MGFSEPWDTLFTCASFEAAAALGGDAAIHAAVESAALLDDVERRAERSCVVHKVASAGLSEGRYAHEVVPPQTAWNTRIETCLPLFLSLARGKAGQNVPDITSLDQ